MRPIFYVGMRSGRVHEFKYNASRGRQHLRSARRHQQYHVFAAKPLEAVLFLSPDQQSRIHCQRISSLSSCWLRTF